jgi:hypothetical protein
MMFSDNASMFWLLAATLLGAAVVLVFAEYLLRLYISRFGRPYYTLPFTKIEMNLHPECAPALTDRKIRYEVNAEGERAGPVPRGDRVYRVLVIGGSAAECRFLDQQKTWSAQLEKRLNTPDSLAALGVDTVHVGLMARSQLDSRGLLATVEHLRSTLPRLDLLIVMNGLSDPLRWLDSGAPSGKTAPVRDDVDYFDVCRATRYTWRQPALVYYLLRRIVARFRVEKHGKTGTMIAKESAARNSVKEFYRVQADPSVMFESFRQNFAASLDMLQGKAERLLVIRQPWLDRTVFTPEEERSLWSGRVGKPGEKPPRFVSHADLLEYCRKIDGIICQVAGERNLECLDLIPSLEPRIGIFYDHFHFAPAGAAAVADTIASAVLHPSNTRVCK